MPGFVRKILIFITGYAGLALLAGPGLAAVSLYASWKAQSDHAYVAREQLAKVTGKVVEATAVTIRKKQSSKKHYEISVRPDGGGDLQKRRIDYSTPQQIVESIIDEQVTVLSDPDDNDLVYEVSINGEAVISYEDTRQRLQAAASDFAQTASGAWLWRTALILTLIGAAGVWLNRRLRAAQARAESQAAAT